MSDVVDLLISNGADVDLQNKKLHSPLHYAAKRNNSMILDSLIKNQAKLDVKDVLGQTPLYYAVVAGNVDAVDILLKKGANYKLEDKFNRTAFHLAAERLNLDIIEVFLKNNVDVDILSLCRQTPLFYVGEKLCYSQSEAVSKEKYLKIIHTLIKHGANINFQDSKGHTPLYYAVINGNVKCVQALLECNADVTIQNKFSKNVLHVAVEKKNCGVVKLLLKKNSNIDMSDELGKTALHLAIESRYLPVIELLLKNKANVNLKDSSGRTALHLALENPHMTINIVKSILNSTNDIDAKDNIGRAAVHYTALNHNVSILEYLLAKNADVNAKDFEGRTPLHLVIDIVQDNIFYIKCVKVLIDHKADINAVDKDLISPLHLACIIKNVEVIKLLIENGADSSTRDKDGRTVFHYACMLGLNKELLWIDKDVEEYTQDTLNVLVEENISVNCVDRFGKTSLHYATENKLLCVSVILFSIGADINIIDKDYNSAFDNLTKLCVHKYHWIDEIVTLYMKHIVRMNVLKLWVQEKMLDKVYQVDNQRRLKCICDYEGVCKREIDLMKSTNLDQSNITCYDFLKKNPHDIMNYTRNQNIVKAIKSDNFEFKFPMYGYILTSRLREIQLRSYLYDQIEEFSKPFIFQKLPIFCLYEIFQYLNNSELDVLLQAMKSVVLIK